MELTSVSAIQGYLPSPSSRRVSVLARKRQEYADAVRLAFSRGEAALDATLWHQIRIDVPRTNPGVPLWQFPSTQKVSPRLSRMLTFARGLTRRTSSASSGSCMSGPSDIRHQGMCKASTISPRLSFRSSCRPILVRCRFSRQPADVVADASYVQTATRKITTSPPCPLTFCRRSKQIPSGVSPSYWMAFRTTTSLLSLASTARWHGVKTFALGWTVSVDCT